MSVSAEPITTTPQRNAARKTWSHEENAALQAAVQEHLAEFPRLGHHRRGDPRTYRTQRGNPLLRPDHTTCRHGTRLFQTARCRGTDFAPAMPALSHPVRLRGSQAQLDLRFVQA